MYIKHENVFEMLNYIKTVVFNSVPEKLWDRDLLIYNKLTKIMDYPFTEPQYRCKNIEFYINKSDNYIDGLICKETYEEKITYFIYGKSFHNIKEFLNGQLREINKSIEIHTTDAKIKEHILNSFNFEVKFSHIKYFTEQQSNDLDTSTCERIDENTIKLYGELAYLEYPIKMLPYFGYKTDDKFVSTCGVAPINNIRAEIIGVKTFESHRNHGYAKAVCNYAMVCMSQNFKVFTWTTDEDNVKSQSLADSLGFKVYLKEYFLTLKKRGDNG